MAESYHRVISAAIADVAKRGYVSPEQISNWTSQIEEAAEAKLGPATVASEKLQTSLSSAFRRLVDQGTILKRHRGADKDILKRFSSLLNLELSQRFVAADDLIRSGRDLAIDEILRKFKSWSTSIPRGGSPVNKTEIRSRFSRFGFEDSRLIRDQVRKLESSLSAILAHEGEALAGEWHSNWRLPGYDFREDHKERDLEVYPIRGNWALAAGLMKKAGRPFLDEIEQVGEWPYCRCWMRFFYSLEDLPKEFLTREGKIYEKREN